MPELRPIAAPGPDSGRPPSNGVLTIRQVNIGQGNLTYVICPNGKRVLIDAGSDELPPLMISDVARHLDYVQPFNAKSKKNNLYVDLVILTHSDDDHFNKISDLLGKQSPVQQIYIGGPITGYNALKKFRQWYQVDSNFVAVYNEDLEDYEYNVEQISVNPESPAPILLCDGAVEGGLPCEIWAIAGSVPPYPDESAANANSIVVKIVFGNTSALITGDATYATENFILGNREDHPMPPLASNIMLVPHHGSEGSSDHAFMAAVHPQIALISARSGNTYGLPRTRIVNQYINQPNMLDDVENHRITTYVSKYTNSSSLPTQKAIWQTGVSGTITYVLDGDRVMTP
jgi:competence protein ComEC